MIFGNIATASAAEIGHEGVLRALEYARTHDLSEFAPGRHGIDGDALYVNVAEYDTKPLSECAFEAHRRYIDVHVVVRGAEYIDSQLVGKLKAGDYDEAGDSMALEGEAATRCAMVPGVFVAYAPEDAHKPGIAMGEGAPLKKAVFKVAVE